MNESSKQAIKDMVSLILNQEGAGVDLQELGQTIAAEIAKQNRERALRAVENIMDDLKRLQEKHPQLALVDPEDKEQKNLLPLIDKNWWVIKG